MILGHLDLPQADRCGDIRHSIIISNNRVPVTSFQIHALPLEHLHELTALRIAHKDHPAFAGRNNFVAEEAESCRIAETANILPADLCSKALGAILDQPYTTLPAEIGNL